MFDVVTSRSLPAGIWDLALDPLDDPSRPAAVARRLRQAIELGLIPVESALPPESELAGLMNVSLMSLRSSLAMLREEGLIKTRRGRSGGNFVSTPKHSTEEPQRRRLRGFNIDAIRDRRDYYTAIAGKSAELAASRARGHAVTRLDAAAQAVSTAMDSRAAVRLDARFHLELAASTRSAMLTKAELAAQNDLTPLLWIPGLECQDAEGCASEHIGIVRAIEARNPELARKRAERHRASALNRLIEIRMRLQEEAE